MATTSNLPIAIWIRHEEQDWSLQAALPARLVFEGGCVYARTGQHQRFLPVFPDSARWDDQHRTVKLDGLTVAIGDEVVLGGGMIDDVRLISYMPSGCDQSQAFQVFHVDLGNLSFTV